MIRKITLYYCPKCGTNLRGSKIPKKKQQFFGASHFVRQIGVYSMDEDRTVAWKCPDCKFERKRESINGL